MSIRLRITLLIVLTFFAIALIGGYSVFRSRDSALQVKSVTEGVVPSALASADLVSHLKDVQMAALEMVSAPDNQIAAQLNDSLTAKRKILKDALDLQFNHADSEVQKGLVQQARESMVNYFDAIDETVKSKLAGRVEIAQASYFGNVVQYQTEMQQIVETLRVEKNRTKDNAISSLNENLATTVTAISVVSALAVIFLTAVGVLLYRAIVGPISRMQLMMTEIASSQDFTRRVPVAREDEIGRSIVAFNEMIEKIQERSAQLRQKTADIQTMLQNIPQGILTVVEENKIHPEYSAYLETVLETTEIADRNVMDLVFSDTNMGVDLISQTDAVIGSCIGEDAMNFAFNVHLLVGEIEKRFPDGRVKILDLSWSPITDEFDRIVRLMLCVRDVTDLRQLAAEANEQRRELEIIGEILAVSQEKFYEFTTSSSKFIDENEVLVKQHREANDIVIAKLFRNMHTVKGNARTYGLRHLTNIVHEAEQRYDDMRKFDAVMAWDQVILLDELARVKSAFERYVKINEVSLSRKGPGRRRSIGNYVTIDKKHIQDSLHRLETVNTANLHELVAARDAVRKTLRLLGTERIREVLSGVLDSLPSLAEQLGKDAPIVHIEDNGYVVHAHAAGTISNVFMHLLRNTIDHGIEPPDVRSLKGKPSAGAIQLRLGVDEGMFQLLLGDDGGGLALHRIRYMAIEKGISGADSALSDEEVAMLIFRPGFSTAEKVTDVSGRGVGMDAVKEFVENENGTIKIRFTDDAVGADFRQFEIVVLLPESYAAFVEGADVNLSGIGGLRVEEEPNPVDADLPGEISDTQAA